MNSSYTITHCVDCGIVISDGEPRTYYYGHPECSDRVACAMRATWNEYERGLDPKSAIQQLLGIARAAWDIRTREQATALAAAITQNEEAIHEAAMLRQAVTA